MYYLSEDPTFLAGSLLLLAGFFVIALKTTQAGKYLLARRDGSRAVGWGCHGRMDVGDRQRAD